jgi:hypothetical protein
MSTRSDLRARVLRVFKRTDKDTEVNEAINDTYKEMVAIIGPRKVQDRLYKSLVADRAEYALPTTALRFIHPIRLIDPDAGDTSIGSYVMTFINKDEYDALDPNPDAADPLSGSPTHYTIWKNCLLVTPQPDKAYTIEINIGGEATALDADSDESIFQETWDETIAAGALRRLYAGIKLYQDSTYWQSVYLYGGTGDPNDLCGGIKLLRQIERDNNKAVLIAKNNPL